MIRIFLWACILLTSCYPPICDQTVVSVCESDNSTTTFITTKEAFSRTVSSSKRDSTCKTYTVRDNPECLNEL